MIVSQFWNIMDLEDALIFGTRALVVIYSAFMCVLYVRTLRNPSSPVVRDVGPVLLWFGFAYHIVLLCLGTYTWIFAGFSGDFFRTAYGQSFLGGLVFLAWSNWTRPPCPEPDPQEGVDETIRLIERAFQEDVGPPAERESQGDDR